MSPNDLPSASSVKDVVLAAERTVIRFRGASSTKPTSTACWYS